MILLDACNRRRPKRTGYLLYSGEAGSTKRRSITNLI